MSRTRFFVVPLVMLVLIGLLIAGGFAIYRIGWTEGYRTGHLAAGVAEGMVVPYAPYGSGIFGLLIAIGLVFLLFAVIGKFFRLLAWKTAWGSWMGPGGPRGERWVRHWHRSHAHTPPWCWDWEESSEEKTQEAESDANSAKATAPM